MFIIFGVKVDDEWVDIPETLHDEIDGIYNILQFPVYEVNIDFNYPEKVQNQLIEWTIDVENCCPVGKSFGVEGIGEGIVFTCETNPDLKFKSKGEKHSVSKVKKLNAVDTELMSNINEFVDSVVTENRLQQGVTFFKENLIEVDAKNTGEFLRWVVTDVLKEESDIIRDSNLDEKKIKVAIVNKARTWFLNQI